MEEDGLDSIWGGWLPLLRGSAAGSQGCPSAWRGMLLCKSMLPQHLACGEWCWADGISQGPPVNLLFMLHVGERLFKITGRFLGGRVATSVY